MNSRKIVAIIVIALIVLLGGWWFLVRGTSSPTTPTSTSTDQSQNETSNTSPSDTDQSNGSNSSDSSESAQVAATITYTDNGFEPKQTTVKSGDTVRITNNTGSPMSLDSDPHPTHTIQPELNVGDVEPGQSKTFVITKVGTWGFHNHDNPSHTGSITVQ